MEDAFVNLINSDPELLIPIFAIAAGLSFALIIVIINSITGTIKSRHREHSRREIAAYIAEGSMTADEGERLIRAAPPAKSCNS